MLHSTNAMKTVEKKDLQASPSDVWDIIKDPGNMSAWNEKCVLSESPESLEVGQEFDLAFSMGKVRNSVKGKIVEYEPGQKIVLHQEYTDMNRSGYVFESYEIEPLPGDRTRLIHTVDFKHSGLPFIFKIVMWFISRFGVHFMANQFAMLVPARV